MYAAGDVRIEDVPDAAIIEPTDAVMRVARACICGSDLWPYTSMERSETGQSMGHEAIGVVEDVGSQVTTIKRGDLVVMPFAYSDGTCAFCHEGLPTACVHVGFFGNNGTNGAQADALRIPFADGTLYPLPVGEDDALMPSLLTLSDVMGTGHHAAVVAKVAPGKRAAVVGDGAVGCVPPSPPSGSAPSRSSSWAATRTASRSPASSVPPTSRAAGGRRLHRPLNHHPES
jgi:threonine dehydrogenase-like Zn-dependent dehydrogenase